MLGQEILQMPQDEQLILRPGMKTDKHDRAVEDSFPASDPPATSGIVGPKTDHGEGASRPTPHERDEDSRPRGTPADDRHATETAHQWEDEEAPRKR
jgi:hypothetical protein